MSSRRCFSRWLVAILALGVATLAAAQTVNEVWRAYGVSYGQPTFAKENRLIVVDFFGNQQQITCVSPNGAKIWSYPIPNNQYVTSILTTTDNLVYVTTNVQTYGQSSTLTALTQDGAFVWDYALPQAEYFNFGDCRVVGSSLVVAGVGRAVALLSSARTIVLSLNRFTGATNYLREYAINNSFFTGRHFLRMAGGSAFIVANRAANYTGTGILKFNPTNGDPLATYAVGPFTVQTTEVDSAGQIYAMGYTNPLLNNDSELRKINGSVNGALPMVYRKTGMGRFGAGDMILSKGAIYALTYPTLRKIRTTDGATLWDRAAVPGSPDFSFYGLRADNYGRIYTIKHGDTSSPRFAWLNLIDPANGGDIDSISLCEDGRGGGFYGGFALNSFGELAIPGTLFDMDGFSNPEGFAIEYFSTQEPVDDVYSIIQGQKLVTSGNGVLANDRYTNPSLCLVSKVPNSGPVDGKLSLSTTGEFAFDAYSGTTPLSPGARTFRYRSSRQGVVREGNVTINVTRGLTNLTLSRGQAAGVAAVSGTITLTSAGPAAIVNLQDDSPMLTTPATATIPANQASGSFTVQASQVAVSTVINITATYETTVRTVSLTLVPLALASLTCTSNIQGGQTAAMDVTLNGRPDAAGFDVAVSDNSIYLTTPGTVHIPMGAAVATVDLQTTPVTSTQLATITASGGGVTKTAKMKINP